MIRVILSTFPQEETALAAIRTLLDEHLIACGTMLPGARSLYRWKQSIEESSETIVFFKISAERYHQFERRLRELHPYEVPEILALDPNSSTKEYAEWVYDSCKV